MFPCEYLLLQNDYDYIKEFRWQKHSLIVNVDASYSLLNIFARWYLLCFLIISSLLRLLQDIFGYCSFNHLGGNFVWRHHQHQIKKKSRKCWRKWKAGRKWKTERKWKPIENGNSYPENKYKLRAENGDIQHTQPVDKHAQKPGNASLPVCRL